jgi:predicted nuclease with TOPRIM domain
MTELNTQADLRYNKIITEYNLKQKDFDNCKDKLLTAEQRSRDILEDFSTRKENQFEKYRIRLEELDKSLLQLKCEKNNEILIKNGYRSLLSSIHDERYSNKDTVVKWLQDFVIGVRGTFDVDSDDICLYMSAYTCTSK